MPQQHTPADQVKFLSQWFLSWSEMQREDFLPVLLQAYQPPKGHLNGMVGSYESMGTRGRRPSLFDCQVKLFHDWFGNWTESDRQTLLEDLRELDPEFMRQYEKKFGGHPDPEEPSTSPGVSLGCRQESQSPNNPSSSVSSPPSTLPRSHSPHDSGLEDATTDSENVESETKDEDVIVKSNDDSNTTTITINTGNDDNSSSSSSTTNTTNSTSNSTSNTTTTTTTTTINTAATPPTPPAKPNTTTTTITTAAATSNNNNNNNSNVTVVSVGGDGGGGGVEVSSGGGGDGGVFVMQDMANGLTAAEKVTTDAEQPVASQQSTPSQQE